MTVSEMGAAESGAVGGNSAAIDPDLAQSIDAWPALAADVRQRILAML